MRLKKAFNLTIIAVAICFIFAFLKVSRAQKQENPQEGGGAKTVIEQALKNYDTQKQNEQEEITAQLNFRLGQATESWLTSSEKNRENQLGTFIEQNWDKQPRTAMILPPVRYDYYLRGYKYSITDSDVIKTSSMTSLYKGVVVVKEELYAEKYHHPNISDTSLYFYTVTNIYTLDFVYKADEFTLVNSDSKMESIVNEIPSEARKEWLK